MQALADTAVGVQGQAVQGKRGTQPVATQALQAQAVVMVNPRVSSVDGSAARSRTGNRNNAPHLMTAAETGILPDGTWNGQST
mgnify:CR=1 FL=1